MTVLSPLMRASIGVRSELYTDSLIIELTAHVSYLQDSLSVPEQACFYVLIIINFKERECNETCKFKHFKVN